MKRKIIVVITSVLLIGLTLVGVTYAQTIPALLNETQNETDEIYSDADTDIGVVCLGEKIHPVLEELAEEFGVDYADLLFYFCDYEFGIGEITHALFTAALEEVEFTYEELLEWRYADGAKDVGWGEIWQALGLIDTAWDDLEDPDEMDDPEDEDGLNPVCAGEKIHPALNSLAESYEADYEELLGYFCEQKFGIGEIMHALKTAEKEDVEMTYDEILDARGKGGEERTGWGKIWQELGLIGRNKSDNGEAVEAEEDMLLEQGESNKSNNKPAVPPGRSGDRPGKGRGPKK
ncbi:MAG: hypothetical protein ACNA70_04025 [Brevefilum sp.]